MELYLSACLSLDSRVLADMELSGRSTAFRVMYRDLPYFPIDNSVVHLQPAPSGLVVWDLFAGVSTGLFALLAQGVRVSQYLASDIDVHAHAVQCHVVEELHVRYPMQFPRSASLGFQSLLPQDVLQIRLADLHALPVPDLIFITWPCQGHSRGGRGRGFDDPRAALFFHALEILRFCLAR